MTEEQRIKTREAQRIYRLTHSDKIKAYARKYRQEHKDEIREKQRKYKAEHRKQYCEYQKAYAKRHPDKVREYAKKYYERNKEKYNGSRSPEETEKQRLRRIEQNRKSYEECDKYIYGTRWTNEEIQFLVDNYNTMTISEIALTTGRTIMAVERKRNKLGLVKDKENVS